MHSWKQLKEREKTIRRHGQQTDIGGVATRPHTSPFKESNLYRLKDSHVKKLLHFQLALAKKGQLRCGFEEV